MDSYDILSEIKIPENFIPVTVASAKFFKVPNALESDGFSDDLIKCLLTITKSGELIEFENAQIKRIFELQIKNPLKIVIHSTYAPFSRFICVLDGSRKLHLFSYEDFEELNSWDDVTDVSSDDPTECGKPSLLITRTNGQIETLTYEDFVIKSESGQSNAKNQVLEALNNRLKPLIWKTESLRFEKRQKELFILQKVDELKNDLKNIQISSESKNLSEKISNKSETVLNESSKNQSKNCLTNPTASTSQNVSTSSKNVSTSPKYQSDLQKISIKTLECLVISQPRQRILRDKWVICVSILNQSNEFLITELNLILRCVGAHKLTYKTRLMSLHHVSALNRSKNKNLAVNFDELSASILKPKRKAFFVAICDIPDFSHSNRVSCDGIITYKIKEIKSAEKHTKIEPNLEIYDQKQAAVPTVTIDSTQLHVLTISPKDLQLTGIPLDIFVLVAASERQKFTLKTLSSPVANFKDRLREDKRIYQIPNVNNFYCFITPNCEALHLSSFVIKINSPHQIDFTLYTKNENHATILLHIFKEMLPTDTFLDIETTKKSNEKILEEIPQLTLNKCRNVIEFMLETFENTEKEGEKLKKKSKIEENKNASNISEDTVQSKEFTEAQFVEWRQKIMQMLY